MFAVTVPSLFTLSLTELPTHTHQLNATNAGGIDAGAVDEGAGGGQAHTNRQPYLVINFCIALQGISRRRPRN